MTKSNTLEWRADSTGIAFVIRTPSGLLSISQWARVQAMAANGRTANVAPLMRAVERQLVDDDVGVTVTLANEEVEALSEAQIGQIGLPPVAPVHLRLGGEGIITSPQFQLRQQLIKTDGMPLMGASRDGVLITFGGRQYVLLFPLYSLLTKIDAFNTASAEEPEARMLRWAELQELLPDTAQVDEHLRTMNIVRADAFSLDTDPQGDISPVLRHRIRHDVIADNDGDDAIDAAERDFEDALPRDPQKGFADRFRRGGSVKPRYAAEGHWYILLPPLVQRGLEVVKRYQNAPIGERLAFIANPKRALRDALEPEFPAEVIEDLFEETPTYLSQRIQCLGQWEPKSFSYSQPGSTRWFPEETDGGILIDLGDQLLPVSSSEIETLLDGMKDALDDGDAELKHREYTIPVNAENVERVETAVAAANERRSVASGATDEPATTAELPASAEAYKVPKALDRLNKAEPLVPVIDDNLESLGFSHRPHAPRGTAGGLPAVLKTTTLFPHQQEGLGWLQEHWAVGSNGALLADDMGLGKTLQTLTFLAWVQEQQRASHAVSRPFLVVAPTGLLKNWEDEERIHLSRPGLGALLHAYGMDLKALTELSSKERRDRITSASWVMTTYETLRDKIQYFMDISWGIVAYDEVQKIKNPTSLIHEMAKSVHSDFFLALTGTPVENRVSDIWSIIDTIAPGHLGSLKNFQLLYDDSSGKNVDATVDRLATLRTNLLEKPKPPRVLRRMKVDHLKGLPTKEEHCIRKSMPAAQAYAYESVLSTLRNTETKAGQVLKALQHLRRVSLSPNDPNQTGITDRTITDSARLIALVNILDEVAEKGEKALVFLEYRIFQDHLITYLQQRYGMDHPPRRINGQTSGERRKKIVDEFQASAPGQFDVVILSPKAAGVGLTLTAANHVVHLSRWWNPAVEDQCTDRLFRIGQEKPVHVHYPLAIHPDYPESSFDINLHQLLDRKRQLSSGLLAPADASDHELNDLLKKSLS